VAIFSHLAFVIIEESIHILAKKITLEVVTYHLSSSKLVIVYIPHVFGHVAPSLGIDRDITVAGRDELGNKCPGDGRWHHTHFREAQGEYRLCMLALLRVSAMELRKQQGAGGCRFNG